MAGYSVKTGCKMVRPLMSVNHWEAHMRVISLYKAYYRCIPYLLKYFDIPKNECDCKWKLREYFYKHAYVTDIRIIDMLVIKGYNELREMKHGWQQQGHVLAYWKPTQEMKCHDFVSRFLRGDE